MSSPFYIQFRDPFDDVKIARPFQTREIKVPQHVRKGESTSGFALAMGIIIIIMFYIILRRTEMLATCTQLLQHCAAKSRDALSAIGIVAVDEHKIEKEKRDKLLLLDEDLADKALAKQMHNLTPCYDDACKNYKTLAAEVKEVNTTAVLEYLSNVPRAVIMIWAPWCGYCELFMPEFAKAAIEANVPFLLINAELVSRDLFTKERMLEVKGFPTFVLINDRKFTPLQARPSKDSLLELSRS